MRRPNLERMRKVNRAQLANIVVYYAPTDWALYRRPTGPELADLTISFDAISIVRPDV